MLASASPPRRCPTRRAASNNSRLMPAVEQNAPIGMNIGMTLRL